MISKWLMLLLFSEYVLLCVVTAIEGKLPLALYWLGASILLLGVMWGFK